MASVLNEESVEKKLLTVTNTQDSIQSLSLWIIHHRSNHAKIVELWMRVLKKTAKPSHRLTLFYLCNDVVQNCKKKKAFVYNTTFKEYLREAACLVRDHSVKNKVERIFNIWGERGVYDTAFIKSLHSILNGQHIKSFKVLETVKEAVAAPTTEVTTALVDLEPREAVVELQTERDAEESARILADFKPHEMIDQITAFIRQETEIKFRANQLAHLKLDVSSLEAVKHLKDRTHGNDFTNHFEDSVMKQEELIKRQTCHLENQRTLLKTLTLSETFYEEQYREAKIVANAYKNFGARINNMKKKLDELKRSMPEPDSPIPSPDINAPSPGSTPPHLHRSGYTYNPATPMDYGQGLQHKSWVYNETRSMSGTCVMNSITQQDSNSFPGSPFEEAPSPDQSVYGSDNASESLDSRLASFFDRRHSGTSDPPVYTPQIPHSAVTSSRSKLVDDEDSATPLDEDETPTTPLQDENLASPPKRNTPPKRENPIDFLSRLISQTQKTPVKTGTQSFLDSLTMLTMATKKPDTDSQQQNMVTTPQAWTAWKSKPNETNMSPPQSPPPSSYGPSSSLPTSPKQFPPVLTMAPPPIPMPIPPPIPLSMPPPPPPFVLHQALPPSFSTPPPSFSTPSPSYQQTSPGQKENWPDAQHTELGNHTNSIRATHSSVLKELVPADEDVATPEPHIDHNGMEVVDPDEVSVTVRSIAETSVESKTEFSQKLKQKSSQGALKSHVFMPNPERPNLMTLTVSDDLDEEDMIDDDTVMEETPAWVDKSDKSGHRSRSQSREKDTSLGSRLSDNESNGVSGVGNVSQKVEVHTDRNVRDSSRGEKCEDYWRSLDRKYDRYDQRGYVGQGGDYRSGRNNVANRGGKDPVQAYVANRGGKDPVQAYVANRGGKDPVQAYVANRGGKDPVQAYVANRGGKDPVQAYAQAYREAFFQYNQARFNPFMPGPPPMGPSRPGFGKY